MTGFTLAILLNPIIIGYFHYIFPGILFWIGVLLTLTGVFLRTLSVWTLRRFFTLSVQVGKEQKIVQSGPYRYLRHPAYTDSILTLLGIALSFRSPLGILSTIAIIAIVYGYRIHVEEKELKVKFGISYAAYAKTTWRLLPYIW
jgi:protein-S-isoprenylcysteine O-methyltransferase Ste14